MNFAKTTCTVAVATVSLTAPINSRADIIAGTLWPSEGTGLSAAATNVPATMSGAAFDIGSSLGLWANSPITGARRLGSVGEFTGFRGTPDQTFSLIDEDMASIVASRAALSDPWPLLGGVSGVFQSWRWHGECCGSSAEPIANDPRIIGYTAPPLLTR